MITLDSHPAFFPASAGIFFYFSSAKSIDIDTLIPLHYYIADGGHCLMAVPKPLLEQALEKGCDMYEVPLPVRYVLEKGWDEISGTDSICVDVPYHDMMGALVPDGYEEF